jgi:hypothetical protein
LAAIIRRREPPAATPKRAFRLEAGHSYLSFAPLIKAIHRDFAGLFEEGKRDGFMVKTDAF